jgi:hypothetical protein
MRQLAPTKVLLGAFLAIHIVVVAAAAAGLLAAGLLTTGLLAAAASALTLILTLILLAGLIPLPSLLLSRLRRTLTFVRTLLHVLGLFGTVRHVDTPRIL